MVFTKISGETRIEIQGNIGKNVFMDISKTTQKHDRLLINKKMCMAQITPKNTPPGFLLQTKTPKIEFLKNFSFFERKFSEIFRTLQKFPTKVEYEKIEKPP